MNGFRQQPRMKDRLSRVGAMGVLLVLAGGCSPTAPDQAFAPNDAELSFNEQIAAVRAKESDLIHIEAAPLTDADLDLLVDFPGLKVLQLDHAGNELTAAGLAKIARLDQLEHLRIRGGSIGDEGLGRLAEMKHLKILNLPQ